MRRSFTYVQCMLHIVYYAIAAANNTYTCTMYHRRAEHYYKHTLLVVLCTNQPQWWIVQRQQCVSSQWGHVCKSIGFLPRWEEKICIQEMLLRATGTTRELFLDWQNPKFMHKWSLALVVYAMAVFIEDGCGTTLSYLTKCSTVQFKDTVRLFVV